MTAPATPGSSWFVATKLHPPTLRSDIIPRPKLEAELKRAVQELPVTLISAPAGYGKTTLLAKLPQLLPDYPLAWVTLDADENDPIRFIGLIAAALQQLHPECAKSAWASLSAGTPKGTDLKKAVGTVINGIMEYLPNPFILVLDDLHFVTEPAVYVALEYLLEHQPDQMHIALGTRYDPPLRLTRLAARRHLAEIRRPDLGFSGDETEQLLKKALDLPLLPGEVEALQKRTAGWPAALCLLAGPLGRMENPTDRNQFLSAITLTERYAQDFLAEEVLHNLPSSLRQFLLQTSILAEMTPATCQAVTGREDAADLLEELYRHNLTIATIQSGEGELVYRHHALFARLLSRQLEKEMPEEITELHRRAAKAQRTPGRAISHYLAAKLWNPAAQLMVESGMSLLHRGMFATIRKWYNALPEETPQHFPHLTVLMARCEIHRGDYVAANRLLQQARAAFMSSGDKQGEGDALTSLITLAYESDNRDATASFVERASELPLGPMGQVAVHLAQAWLSLGHNDYPTARQQIHAGLAVPAKTGNRQADVIGITYMSVPLAAVPGCLEVTERYCAQVRAESPPGTAWRLGAEELSVWPLIWRGEVEKALGRAEAAENLRQQLGGFPFVGNDLPAQLSLLYLAEGKREAAEEALEALLERMEGAGRSKWMFHFHAAGRTLALLGRLSEARAIQQRLQTQCSDTLLTQYLRHHLAGLVEVVNGNAKDAAALLKQAVELEAQLPIAWIGGSARMLQARLLFEAGRPQAAWEKAAPVLTAWAERGTPGCALLDGPSILPVLRLASEYDSSGALHFAHLFNFEPAERPLEAAAETRANLAGLAEPLTPRELDVLKLLVAGRTNRQIGEELFISTETVKSHVAHILRKLDVSSRTQAALRAQELGL